jgi:hypothetical protein
VPNFVPHPAQNPSRSTPSPSPVGDQSQKTATVAGQAVRADTGEPLKKAQASLQTHGGDKFSVFRLTDEQGHFSIENIPPGSYDLEVSRNGYVDNEYGQKKPGGSGAVLTLPAGQHMTDLIFKMVRGASISGHVYDEDGEPVAYAQVICYRASRQPGKEQQIGYRPVITNDLGEFRVFDLKPGRYYVAVDYHFKLEIPFRSRGAEKEAESDYAATFYPNTMDVSKAVAISVSPGDELRSIDFLLRPVHYVTVSGRVINTVPTPPYAFGGVGLLSDASGLAAAYQSLYDSYDVKDGKFAIHNVPPGSYTLSASWSDRESREWHSARRPLEVGSTDIEGVTITIAPGVNVAGRVAWEGSPTVEVHELMVWLRLTEEKGMGPYQPQTPKADGSFVIKSVSEGTYRPLVTSRGEGANFYMKSARYGTLSIPESGFAIQPGGDQLLEITLSSRAAQVSGVVLNSDSLPAAGVTVVLIPEVARRSYREFYKSATTDQNGKFAIKGIAPGDYTLFSWESVEGNEWSDADWFDAAWLKPFEAKGESIHLGEAETKSVDLTLIETTPVAQIQKNKENCNSHASMDYHAL